MSVSTKKILKAVKSFIKLRNRDFLGFIEDCGNDYAVWHDLEDDALVFAKVVFSRDGLPDDAFDKSEFERVAADWLEDHGDLVDIYVRGDVISIHVIADDRAFMRHHKGFI